MHNPVGTEIEATAQWLEQHAADGAATVLRRVARQRAEARERLTVAVMCLRRYRMAWRSARRRARARTAEAARLTRQLNELHAQWHGRGEPSNSPTPDDARERALMRIDLARFQNLVERAGWMPDAEPRRLWRWRNGWWELAYRKKNPKDGYHDSGWYLWGPTESYFGEWVAPLKADATIEADRLIAKDLAAVAEEQR